MVTNGIKVGEYRPLDSEREIDIRVRFPKSERTIDQLDRLTVNTFRGQVPVSSFVDSKPVPETTTINRKDGKRSYQITGEKVPGSVTSEEMSKLYSWIEDQNFSSAISFDFDGFAKYNAEALTYLVNAFILTLFLMGIVMVTQFNSFYQASVIMSAILLSFGGVFLSLIIFGRPISTMQDRKSVV